jgi:Tfp pilus assembly pilus retraction ATPase PilT
MISALLLIKMDGWVTEQAKERIQSQSLSNAKQLIVGAIRDDVVVDVAANTAQDLHLALATFAQLPAVRSVTVVRVDQSS